MGQPRSMLKTVRMGLWANGKMFMGDLGNSADDERPLMAAGGCQFVVRMIRSMVATIHHAPPLVDRAT